MPVSPRLIVGNTVSGSQAMAGAGKVALAVGWLSPAGAEHIARPGLAARPLDDPEIHLETHLAALTGNTSPLVAEYFRCFLAQVEEDHSPVQLVLPLAGVLVNQSWNEDSRVLKSSA